ncbi:MAG TPA: hypothetical protein VGR61_11125 [Candidatus Dormibacteraeota bacterium]|nr:hypothetical protein [Candidatus Dormibacteraeota bacterium]
MKTQGRATALVRGAILTAIVAAASGCSLGQSVSSDTGSPTPGVSGSPNAAPAPSRAPWLQPEAELTDYSTRLGNNRVAAETAIRLGRVLFAQQQYWEAYVTTDPAILKPDYDPGNLATFDRAAKEVSRVDMLIATESGPAIKAFGLGGAEHEKTELTGLAKLLLSIFPSARTVGFQVLFGENNPHANATYQAGHLDYHGPPAG